MDVVELIPEWEFGTGRLIFRCEVYDESSVCLNIEFSFPSSKLLLSASHSMGGWEADTLIQKLLAIQQDDFSSVSFVSEDQGLSLLATAIDGSIPALSVTLRFNALLGNCDCGWETVLALRAMRLERLRVLDLAKLLDSFMNAYGICRDH